jgi:hypothetical protein
MLIAYQAVGAAGNRATDLRGYVSDVRGAGDVRPVSVSSAPGDVNYQSSGLSGPVLVSCGVSQRAVIRQTVLNGERVSQVECVPDGAVAPIYADPYGRAMPVSSVYPEPYRPIQSERVAYQPAARTVAYRPAARATSEGIGGIFGGKKGALIGAAIGGGASTIYEARKH